MKNCQHGSMTKGQDDVMANDQYGSMTNGQIEILKSQYEKCSISQNNKWSV